MSDPNGTTRPFSPQNHTRGCASSPEREKSSSESPPREKSPRSQYLGVIEHIGDFMDPDTAACWKALVETVKWEREDARLSVAYYVFREFMTAVARTKCRGFANSHSVNDLQNCLENATIMHEEARGVSVSESERHELYEILVNHVFKHLSAKTEEDVANASDSSDSDSPPPPKPGKREGCKAPTTGKRRRKPDKDDEHPEGPAGPRGSSTNPIIV